jgi:hypothetical protein
MKESAFRHLRWFLADWLSFLACKLRGHKWYTPDNYASVPGNRVAELKQNIWESVVSHDHMDGEWLEYMERGLGELAQLAGENWGHIRHREKEGGAA